MKLLQKFCLFSVIFLFAFLLFGIIQQTNAVPPYCGDYHPTRTKIRNVIIDNNIPGYNIVISNGTTIIIEEAQSPIRDVGGDINVYLIPDYFDNDNFIDKCSGWECSVPTDTPNVDLWQVKPNDNFDFEKYKIGTISSGKFQNEVDFHEVRSWHDSFCAETDTKNEAQHITYHYNIQKIGHDYVLHLAKLEKQGNIIRLGYNYVLHLAKVKEQGNIILLLGQYVNDFLDKFLDEPGDFLDMISKCRTVIVILPFLVFLFFGIKHLHKNDKLSNKKQGLILGSLGIIVVSIIQIFLFIEFFDLYALLTIFIINSLISTLIFKYALFTKRKYAIIFGILYFIFGILGCFLSPFN